MSKKYNVAAALVLMTTTSLTGCSDTQSSPTASAPNDPNYDQRLENNCQSHETEVCQVVAENLSKREKWLAMVAHGGNDRLYGSIRRTAMCLNNNGIRAYIVHASDRDGTLKSMHVDFYTKGATKFGLTAYDNWKNTPARTDEGFLAQAVKEYERSYRNAGIDMSSAKDCLKKFRDNSPKH